jgi:glycosyltransferase involved in cell wall biosynthesis
VLAKKNPKISTVMSVYNAEKYIAAAINSILQQTIPSTEIIVINDGSTDNTLAILQSFTGLTIISRENKGMVASLNEAIALTTGEYLTFLDADDLWDARKTQLQLEHLATNPYLDFSLCYVQQFYEAIQYKLAPQKGFFKQGLLINKKTFLQVGNFDPHDAGHFMLWFQQAKLQQLNYEVLAVPLVLRRIHDSNYTRTSLYAQGLTKMVKCLIERHRV